MQKTYSVLIIAGFISTIFADSATQTDWSGGPGWWNKAINWNSTFFADGNVNYFNPGYITMQSRIQGIYDLVDNPRGIYCKDIDGDMDIDILGAMESGNAIIWYENADGAGYNWIAHTIADSLHGPNSVYSQDMDNDGDMDVLSTERYADDVKWWENVDGTGNEWIEHMVEANFNSPLSVCCADINGDGYMDVLASSAQGDLSWWKNADGSGSYWLRFSIDGSLGYAPSVYSEDINGDGRMDVLGTSFPQSDVIWWENANDSGTVFVKHVIDNNFTCAHSICSEDINGDGHMDVICTAVGEWWSSSSNALGGVKWWQNYNGSGNSWLPRTIDTDCGFVAVHSGDLEGDGDMDVVCSGYEYDDIHWYLNENGLGTQWDDHVEAGSIPPSDRAVFSEDINGDGKYDLISAEHIRIVWRNLSTEAWLESSLLALDNDPGWGSIDWACVEPPGTSVAFQVRSSDSPDSTQMGAWSDTIYSPCSLAGILDEYDSFFQYRVILQTSDPSVSPDLEDVTITWDPVGIEGAADDALRLFPAAPNPSNGFPVLRFSLSEPDSVELLVYDLSGRIIQEIEKHDYSAGYHDVQLEDLSPGIYFCRMRAGEYAATEKFTVLN